MAGMNHQRLRELRRMKGMTQAQLARELGVSASAVGMYEQGRREPDYEMLARICACFRVSADFLLGGGTQEERRDLDEIIEDMREALLAPDGLMFNGELVDPADCDKIVDAVRLGVRFVLEQRKAGDGTG